MIAIVFGSNGGRARDCALDLYLHFNSSTAVTVFSSPTDFSRFDLLIFIISTGGHGAFPMNFFPIWKKINKIEKVNKFCIFGLGDSRYERYNYAARRVRDVLLPKGCEYLPLCLGDDQDPLGYQAMFHPWKLELLSKIGVTPILSYPRFFSMRVCDAMPMNIIDNSTLLSRECAVNADAEKQVYMLDIKLDTDFNLGDVLAIYYQPAQDVVNSVLKILNIDPSTVVDLKIEDKNYKELGYDMLSEGKYSVETLLRNFFDLNSFVSPWMMSLLAKFATLSIHAEKLEEFGSPSGLYLFNKYADYERRSLADVLIDFNSIKMNVEELINIIPPILPRYYSISNAPGYTIRYTPTTTYCIFNSMRLLGILKTNIIHKLIKLTRNNYINKLDNNITQLCIALVENYTISGKKKLGNCSNWLINELEIGNKFHTKIIPCQLSSFCKKRLIENPTIFLATGTGVSAIRPWLMHKLINHKDYNTILPNLIITGFRKPKELLYPYEWILYTINSIVDIAYSRHHDGKRYIQHALPKHTEVLLNLILNNCIIYISGRSKDMPTEIISEIIKALNKLNYTKEQAMKLITHLEASERLIFETW